MDVDPVAKCIHLIDVEQLASLVQNDLSQVLIIDSRSFLEYNTSHIFGAVNVCCSKIVKRRLQQDKVNFLFILFVICTFLANRIFNLLKFSFGLNLNL